MFLDRFAFLQPLMARGRRQPTPTTSHYVDDTEHEMSTLGAKPASRPPLRARLFSVASSMSTRSGRSVRPGKSTRSNPRIYRGREERQSLLSSRRSGHKQHSALPPQSLKPAAAITMSDKASRSPPAKFKRRGFGRSPKIPPQPMTLQLSCGPERDELDAQAAELRRRIMTQRRRLAADLDDGVKPFPR